MLCSSSEGLCLEGLRGSILFNAGPLIFAVVVRNGLGDVESFLAGGWVIFLREGIFWGVINWWFDNPEHVIYMAWSAGKWGAGVLLFTCNERGNISAGLLSSLSSWLCRL